MVPLRVDLPFTDENKTVRLVPTSCQHFGSRRFHQRRFKQFLTEQMTIPQSYLILMGDIFDAIIPADGKRYDPRDIEPKYLLADQGQVLNMALNDAESVLRPYKDQIIGVMMGNHEYEFDRRYGLNLTQMLCERLNVRNLGMSFLMWLQLQRSDGQGGQGRSVKIYGHHGYGGNAKTSGGSITKYERSFMDYNADIMLFGHDHKTWKYQRPRIDINSRGKIVDSPLTVVCCGTFKRSLSDNEVPTWEEKMGFGPQMLKGQTIEITVKTHGWVEIE
jgi:hypothetical protein